jgi:putative ABC transport system substrate-binding protein
MRSFDVAAFDVAQDGLPEAGERKKFKLFGFALCALLFAISGSVEAQQPGKIPRIGYLTGTGDSNDPGPFFDAFRHGLRNQGYIEGKNILVEHRYAEGRVDRIPSIVADLVQLKVDALVLGQLQAIRAAKQITNTIPIIMVTTVDPVTSGLIDSFARPGSNITGITLLTRDLNGKRLELLKEVVPTVSRVGILFGDSPNAAIRFQEYEVAARELKIPLQSLEVRSPTPDLDGIFQAATKGRASALIAIPNSLLNRYTKEIADLGLKSRLPTMCERNDYVEAGGLLSYSASNAEVYRRAAYYVDKVLKGAKPADLPVEQPTKFEMMINLKTAKQIGIAIPPNVLARADRVIK